MVKLGQQVKAVQPQGAQFQPTRTERIQSKQLAAQREQEVKEAQEKLGTATSIAEYEQIYNTLTSFQKSQFASPNQLRSEKQKMQESNIAVINQELFSTGKKIEIARTRANDASTSREAQQRANAELDRYIAIQSGLAEGKRRLEEGKSLSSDSIIAYAERIGDIAEQSKIQETYNAEQARINAGRQLDQQAKGFTLTGTVQEFNVNQKTGKQTLLGTRYFLGGSEVVPETFVKQFDIYTKTSGGQLIVARGTDFSKLSPAQQEKLFPIEFEQARQKKVSEQRADAQTISDLDLSPIKVEEKPKTLFSKVGSTVLKGLGLAGDLIGSIIPDVYGSGSRGLEPTALSEQEILARRENIKKSTFNLASLGLFSISGGGAATRFAGRSPTIIEADIESFKLRRDIAKGADKANDIQGVINSQIGEINIAQNRLTKINEQVSNLNAQLSEGKPVSPEKAVEIQQKYDELQVQRSQVYQDLASKGIKTKIDIGETGETITFVSPELETDLASAYAKEFRTKTPGQRKAAIAGSITEEVAEGAILGLALGGSGALTKLGTGISKIPGIGTVITKFPTASKIALEGTFFVGTGFVAGVQSYKTGQEFKQQGLNPTEGYLLGFGIPAGKASGFYGGAKIGTKFYTESILEKVSRGGFTKTVQKEVEFNGKKGKLPAEGREVQEVSAGDRRLYRTAQASIKETKIPGTDIKIEQKDYLRGGYKGQAGFEAGKVATKVTRGQAPIAKGSTSEAKTFFIKPEGQDQTGIVAVSKAKGGVNVDIYRTSVKSTDVQVLKQFSEGSKLYILDFQRPITKVGETIFVKGASLNDLSKVRAVIDTNRIFTSFTGEDRLFAVARTRQLVFESAPKATGFFDTTTGTAQTVKQYISIGTTKAGRIDAIKDVLKAYGIETKDQSEVFKLLSNKRGQSSLFFKPSVTVTSPTSISLDKLTGLKDVSTLLLPNVVKDIAPIVTSDIALRSILGISAISATGARSRSSSRERQEVLQAQIQNLIQLNIQQQQPQQQQKTQQNQSQQQQRQLIQQELPIVNIPGFPAPTAKTLPGSVDLDFQLFQKVRQKASRRRSGKDLAYVQDFTSKILETTPQVITEKQLARLVGKTQTGFESRPPVILARNNKDAKRLKKLLAQ